MKEINIFYLTGCPYCKNAKKAVDEILNEDKKFSEIKINWLEENLKSDIAEKYNYYYVPTIFYGAKKLYEANPSENYQDIKSNILNALNIVLSD